ncbi:toprim domain-containing protein [Dyella agri]|uniref:Toprim domain-containing protein n=1 Tax=Dyella agri TaxID=1926869 RepID=A0ABW8KIC9_9GAMM
MAKVVKPQEVGTLTPVRRAKLLERVVAFYHQRFLDRPEGLHYLTKVRGIRNLALFRDYRVGYADGSLLEALPQDEDSLAPFQSLGVLTDRLKERFAGCVVFPLFAADGTLINLYGRRIQDGAPKHVVLPDVSRGVWNAPATRRSSKILITGSPIDAITLIDRGIPDVVPCIGDGVNEDHLALLRRDGLTDVLLALPGNLQGRKAESAIRAQLADVSVNIEALHLPDGDDINSFLSQHEVSEFQVLMPKVVASSAVGAPDCQNTAQGLMLSVGARRYEVKAFLRQGTQLKATIKASGPKAQGFELHTLDLYSARSRDTYAVSCAVLFAEDVALIKADLDRLLERVEAWTPETGAASSAPTTLTDRERESGLALLRDPLLLDRIERDLTTLGMAGESLNKRLCYLAAISRKLDDPLSLLIQSRSAAGKSTLQNLVLSLVPDEDKVVYTRMTDQALFYQDPTALMHRVVALEEAEGLGGAAYSLRALQSSKQLAIATTSKDPVSGKMRSEHYLVQGPVAVLLTTTSAALDEETASRFLTVTIDESTAMTERIFERQREADTLAGYLRRQEHDALIQQHHAAQRLLEPVVVINPYAPQLKFPAHSLRARRDHKKYLMLIKAIAFLHQKQRPVKEVAQGDQVLRYIEVTREDIRAANALAETVMGSTADELSAPARNLLGHIHALVKQRAAEQDVTPSDLAFTRKTIRDGIGWSDWQVRTHIRELEELEYLRARSGAWGKEYVYEILGASSDDGLPVGLTLTDSDDLCEPTL